ncbi:MAG: T9SS type A sorting domain-containing protein [Bacteroidia bacterium]
MFSRSLLSLFVLLFTLFSQAQLSHTTVQLVNDIAVPKPVNFPLQSYGKAGSCGVDTLYYPYYKTSAFYAVALNASNSGTGFGQWFQAPQPVTISGFDFFAWQSAGTGAAVTITCNLYLSTSDSLPFANPARSVTIQIDSTFGGGVLSALRKHAKFAVPITISTPYVVTLETSSSTSVSVICNNYNAGDGDSEWLSSVELANTWRRAYGINVGGSTFDADFILMPTVAYELNADFFFSGCNNGNSAFTFTNTSSAVMQNRFYNRYAFYNIPQYGMMWDYGDTTGLYYAVNGAHTYTKRIPYQVTLKDTFYGWTTGCVDIRSKTVPYTPLPPALGNDGPHCSGDSAHLFADTLPGLSYSWTGPNGFSSTTQNNFIPVTDTSMSGTYTVNVKYMTCTSKDTSTELLIHQTPQTPTVTNDGPKCVGDSVSFSAFSPSPNITYRWSGPNGFMDSSAGFRFYSLDTTNVGTYYAFVEDGNCVSGPDSTELYTYPPPQVPVLMSLVGDSVCQGDTVYFKGQSVTGAVFDWTGPNGFQSDTSSPYFVADDTLQSGFYQSRVVIGSCISDPDSFYFEVLRSPVTSSITGYDTSTTGLIKTYSSPRDYRDGHVWTCLGGTILSMDSITGSIQVQWGPEGTGILHVITFTQDGCFGSYERMEVDILALPPPIDHTSITKIGQEAFRVYPNPAGSYLVIERMSGTGDHSYLLMTMEGKVLQAGNAEGNTVLNLSGIAAGIYMLRIQGEQGISAVKVEVLH